MRDRKTDSTPKGQTLPAQPDSIPTTFQNLRRKRDQRVESRASAPSRGDVSPLSVLKFGPAAGTSNIIPKPLDHDRHTTDVQAVKATVPPPVIPGAETSDHSPGTYARSTTRYTETAPVFAVDVSWSTNDRALDEEKAAIRNLSQRLSPATAANARIIPWSSQVSPPIEVSQVDTLCSLDGTRPHNLTKDQTSAELLAACSLWFLFTDGAIDDLYVQRFAEGVSANGLHGKACVIVIFGQRDGGPLSCNVSVGMAVFPLASDCAFLYYEVDSADIIVLQCKGCFRRLLPQEHQDIVIHANTQWDDLPKTTWDELTAIDIPSPVKLGPNSVLLKSGREVDVEELYGNRLTQAAIVEILDDDDNLKSILLNAHNRGRSKDMAKWIAKRRTPQDLPERFDRPDLNGNAARLVNKLVNGKRYASLDPQEENSLKHRLREAHLANWTTFLVSAESTKGQVAQRNTMLEDAMSRVELSRENRSPRILSPVSPSTGSSRLRHSLPPPPEPYNTQLPSSDHSNICPSHVLDERAQLDGFGLRRPNESLDWREGRYLSYSERQYLLSPSPFPENPEMSKLLYTKRYKLESRWSASSACRGRCGLCEDESSPLALLLKAKPSDCATEGDFPAARSYQPIIYPMAMCNYAETDVISSFLCCEKCAYFIRRLGASPFDDEIVGAIPLISNSEGKNRHTKLQEIDVALEGRFDTTILDQIFMSVLYQKLDDVVKSGLPRTDLFAKALRWEAKNWASTVVLHIELSACFGSPRETMSTASLLETMSFQLQNAEPIVSMNLLRYPVKGFVTLLKGYLDNDRLFHPEDVVMKAVFQRLLFYLAEQQFDLREQIGSELAAEELRRVLSGETGGIVASSFRADVEALEGTYLLEPDDVESFRRLQPWFGGIERDCAPAIRLFLQLMLDLPWKDGPAEEMLRLIPLSDEHFDLFNKPWTLDEDTCRQKLMS